MKDKILLFMPILFFWNVADLLRYKGSDCTGDILMNQIDHERYDVDYYDLDAYTLKKYGNHRDYFKNYDSFESLLKDYKKLLSNDYKFIIYSSQTFLAEVVFMSVMILLYLFPETTIYVGGSSARFLFSQTISKGSSSYFNFLADLLNVSFFDAKNYKNLIRVETVHPLMLSSAQTNIWKIFNKDTNTMDDEFQYYSNRNYIKEHQLNNEEDLVISYNQIMRDRNLDIQVDDRYIKQATLQLSSGCTNRCSFCAVIPDYYSIISLQEMKDTIMSYLDRGYNSFMFLDRLTNKWPEELYHWIVRENLDFKWSSSFSAAKTDLDYWKMIYEAGCRLVSIGFESPSPRMLKFVRKNVNLKQIEKAVEESHKANLFITGNFIIGMPSEGPEDLKMLVKFIERNKNYINFLAINSFSLRPISDFYINSSKYGITVHKIDDWYSRSPHWENYGAEYTENEGPLSGLSYLELEDYKGKLRQFLVSLYYDYDGQFINHNISQHYLFALIDLYKNKKDVMEIIKNNNLDI